MRTPRPLASSGVAALLGARHALPDALLVIALVGVSAGGAALWTAAILAALLGCAADEAIGDEPGPMPTLGAAFGAASLYAAVPLLVALFLAHAVLAARAAQDLSLGAAVDLVVSTVLVGYLYALIGATVGHELVHRVGDRAALVCSCLLLAFTFNTGFTLFHVEGHHRNVGLLSDPASARRGESCFAFLGRTILLQTVQAYRLEARHLQRAGIAVASPRNRFLQRLLYPVVIICVAWGIGGAIGLAAFVASAVLGRFFHESVNYVQHYGLVRVEHAPVEPRHTWNCDRLVSNALQFNLPHHAAHHLSGARPYWRLSSCGAAPKLPHGYQTMALIALVPAWWNRVMLPLLARWDSHSASEMERALLHERGCDVVRRA